MVATPLPAPETLAAYWDWQSDAVLRWGRLAESLDEETRAMWLEAQGLRLMDRLAPLTDRQAAAVGVVLAEDLYRTVAMLTEPAPPGALVWLEATAAPVLALLAERGLCLHYLIENDVGPALGGPLLIYPEWFRAAGLAYVCPHHMVWTLEVEDQGRNPDEVLAHLPDLLPDAWGMVPGIVRRLRAATQPVVVLDPGADGGPRPDLAAILGLGTTTGPGGDGAEEGVLGVWRDQAPTPGSAPRVFLPPRLR